MAMIVTPTIDKITMRLRKAADGVSTKVSRAIKTADREKLIHAPREKARNRAARIVRRAAVLSNLWPFLILRPCTQSWYYNQEQ